MDKFLNLIVVVASWEYAYIQTHRNVCTKYVKILFTKYTSIQLTKEKKWRFLIDNHNLTLPHVVRFHTN